MAKLEKSAFKRFRDLLHARPVYAARTARTQQAEVSTEPDDPDQTRALFRSYEATGAGWFWSTDETGAVVYISESVAVRLGATREQIRGKQFDTLFAIEASDDDRLERTLPLLLNAHKTFSSIVVRPASGDAHVWWAVSGRPRFSPDGAFIGYYGHGSDVTDGFISRKAASQLAMFDPLTGLSSRTRITRRLDRTLDAYASTGRSCAIMMIDLDRFKQVNDTLGHPAGDALLKQVGERLRQSVGDAGEIGRLGGDEFEVVLPDLHNREKLAAIADKIIAMVSQPYSLPEGRCVIGASVGIAIAPGDGADSQALVRAADLALYAAKHGGRGLHRFYSTELDRDAERRRQIEQDLRQALKRDEMRLVYQPQVDGANKVVALQASREWQHPEFDRIPPEVFLPIAHEINLIRSLNDWALRQACEDGASLPGGVRIAVKVAQPQIATDDFPTLVTQALAASQLAPDRLELELPATTLAADWAGIEGQLVSLKMLGVRLVLDGFGAGCSSLEHLRDFTFDNLKIADTFVRGVVEAEGRDRAIVRSIIALANDLGMSVVADGVAGHDELESLRGLRVDRVQGPVFSKAIRLEDVVRHMASGDWTIEPLGPSLYREEGRKVLRNVGAIHENYRYEVRLKSLSTTGCLIEGLLDVPVGTQFVLDLGNGHLAVATVSRSAGAQQGMVFETPLVEEGGELITRKRVSPYVLAAAGMPADGLVQDARGSALAGNPTVEVGRQPRFARMEKG